MPTDILSVLQGYALFWRVDLKNFHILGLEALEEWNTYGSVGPNPKGLMLEK